MLRRLAQMFSFDRSRDSELAETLMAAENAAETSSDPDDQIAAWSKVLEIEPRLDPWPFEQFDRHSLNGNALGERGNAYYNRSSGDRSDDLEAAIADYDAALEIHTRKDNLLQRALIQIDRADVFLERIRGDRAENLEAAIASSDAALEVFTRHGMPDVWAMIQMTLARAYGQRIRGDRADNMEATITNCDAAMEVFTRDAKPDVWAQNEMNRATGYVNRIRGDRADNIEIAIAGFDAAMEIRTREAMPVEWAEAQMGSAIAFLDRIRGDRTDNLEAAIAGIDAVLEIRTREVMPVDWAITQMTRANAYSQRIRGDRADNLEAAIAGYDAALEILTREARPLDWAMTQINRASSYVNRIRGDRADNIEIAIAGFDAAMEIRTREAMPVEWAEAQMNRATGYVNRIRGDRADNIEIAIAGYDAVLEIRTREAMPVEWAMTQMARAGAYGVRIRGDRTDNLKAAIAGCDAALEIHTREAMPNDHLRTSRLLGATHLEVSDWAGAAQAFSAARSTADQLIGQGLNEAETARVLEEASIIGPYAAFALAKCDDALGALRELEAGRARQLAIALHQNTARDALCPKDRTWLDTLSTDTHAADRALEVASEKERQAKLDTLIKLRRELATLVEKGQAVQAKGEPSIDEQLESIVSTGTTLIAPVFTQADALLLLAYQDSHGMQIESVEIAGVSADTLNAELEGKNGWLTSYISDNARTKTTKRIGKRLWNLVAGPLVEALEARDIAPGSRLVILPQGALGLLPLGLAQDPQTGERLFERYELSLSPSIAALQDAGRKFKAPSLAAIVNPTEDLFFTPIEAALVRNLFNSGAHTEIRENKATTKSALKVLKGKSHWLFSCHGAFNWNNPRQSGLALANDEALTLDTLLSSRGLGSPRLVVLSACETGLHDIQRSPEEFIGLPAAFLQLGAAGVLATLWPVNDLSTALLVSRFFHHHIAEDMLPAAALKVAQLWLRDLTVKDLRAFIKETELSENSDAVTESLADLQRDLEEAKASEKPFQHPYYWGGFALHGQ